MKYLDTFKVKFSPLTRKGSGYSTNLAVEFERDTPEYIRKFDNPSPSETVFVRYGYFSLRCIKD